MSLIIFIFLFFVGLLIYLNLPSTKDYLAKKGLEELNKEFKTEITAKSAEIDFFGRLVLNEVVIKDHHKLDFITVKKLKASIDFVKLALNIYEKFDKLYFTHISAENLDAKVITYKGEEIDNFLLFIDKFDDKKPSTEPSTFQFLSEVDILNSKLSIINRNLQDSIWLDAKNVNISVNELKTVGSDVSLNIIKLQFDAKKNNENYRLNQFATFFTYSKTGMKLKDLSIETQSSTLFGDLEFKYKDPKELSDFNEKVIWDLNLKPTSILSGKDIRYFSKNWDSDTNYKIVSSAKGTLNNLKLEEIQLVANNNFISAKNLNLKNILDSNYQITSKDIKFQTSNADLKTMLPTFIASKLKNYIDPLKKINYTGDFSINPKELITKGNLISALGKAEIVLKMNDFSGINPKYKGKIKTKQFNLSSLIKDETVQNFAGEISFAGTSFDSKKVNVNFNANFSEIHLLKYKLKNQKIVGKINNQTFNGKISSNDSTIKFTADAFVDYSSKVLKIKTDAIVEDFDLYHYGLTEIQGERVSTSLSGEISFSSMKDVKIDGYINQFVLNSPKNSITFSDLKLETYLTEDGRFLAINSPSNINLKIDGKYNLKDLPETIKDGIGGMLVGYKPQKRFKDQNYTFELEIEDSFLELFVKNISFNTGTKLYGSYNGNGNYFDLHLNSPKITYDNISAENLKVNFNTSDVKNSMQTSTDLLTVSNKFIRNVTLKAEKNNDTVVINSEFFIEKELKKPFKINMYQTKSKDDILFGFLPSTFLINEHLWEINPTNDPTKATGKYNFNTKEITLNDLIIDSDEAQIELDGVYKSVTDIKTIANFKDVRLEKFIPKEQLGDIELEGIANGIIDLKIIGDDIRPIIDLKIDTIKINSYLVGNLVSNVKFNDSEKSLDIDTRISNENIDNITLKGKIIDIFKKPKMDLTAEITDLKTSILGGFLKGIISNVQGNANGSIKLDGELSNPDYNGILSIKNFAFKVDYLNVIYKFDEVQDLKLYSFNQSTNKKLGNIFIEQTNFYNQDGITKRTGNVSGVIQTIGFTKWFLNLDFESDNLMVLNTTSKNNELFYGKVFAKGNFNLNNGDSEIYTVKADVTALEGSKLTLNTGIASSIDENTKILVFKKDPNKKIVPIVKKPEVNLNLDFKLKVDEKSTIRVLLDETTGDEIVAQGESKDLRFQMSGGAIKMNGQYLVKGGSEYHFKTLLDKKFTIDAGSSIVWNGNPYDADLNIVATQTKQVSNAGDFLQLNNIPVIPVDLKVIINNTLSAPEIKFSVTTPRASQQVKEELFNKLNNNYELEKNQFGIVLLTGKFITKNGSAASGAANSAYEVAIRQLVNFLNNFSSKIQVDLNFAQSDELSETQAKVNAGLKINLSPRWNLKTSVGVPVGGNANNAANANNQLTAEGEIEYDFSRKNDNTFLIRFFSRPTTFGLQNYNLGGTQLQSYGSGFVYRKSFNTFREFLGMKPKNKKELKKDTLKGNK